MKGIRLSGVVAAAALAVGLFAPSADAVITSVTQNSVPNLDPLPPRIEPATLEEESFAFVDRTHELTSARYVPATGLLTTDATTGTLVGFPSYLIGAQYVANANDNRTAGTDSVLNDYLVTYTVDTPSIAYLLLDNRLDGAAGNVSKTNTTDPNLGGNLAWVINDGWTRVNSGIMPNGQADYIGIDEGGTVAGPDARTHHDAGPGVSLNQFYAIYSKEVTDSFVTRGIRQATGSGNMYVVAVVPIPEPGTIGLVAMGAAALLVRRSRR
jgi:hypothetical protein